MSDDAKIIISLLIFCVFLLIGGYFLSSARCDAMGVSFEESRYGLLQKCMVKHNGKWLPLENIRGFD